MTRAAGRLVLVWLAMLVLLAGETALALMWPGRFAPGAVLALGLLMVAVVGFAFMRLRGSPKLSHAFVIAALFWVVVLLGLGGMDPFTRIDYPVPVTSYP